ncbi:hypothetical protein Tco_0537817 [Tanacetum coccineum]
MTTSKLPSLIGKRSILKVASSVIGGILSIEARDMDTKLLSALESNNTLARCWFRRNIPVTTFGSQLAFLSLSKYAFPWALLFSFEHCSCWGGSIRPEGFLSFILLLAVIIVVVAMVVLVVVDAIIGNCALLPDPSTSELCAGDLVVLFYSNRLGVCIPPGQDVISQGVPVGSVFLLGLLVLAIVVAYASRSATTLSATSFLMAA